MRTLRRGPIIGLDPASHKWQLANSGAYPITVKMTDGWRPYGVVLDPGETRTFTQTDPIGWRVPPRGSFARIGLEVRVHLRRIGRQIRG